MSPRSWWRAWVRLWSLRESGESLALARMLCGLSLVISVQTVAGADLVPVLWADAADGGFRSLEEAPWPIALLGGPTATAARTLAALTALGGLLLMLGVAARAAALVALVSFVALVRVNGHDGSAYDSLLVNQVWLFVFADSAATWSLGCRLRTGSWASDRQIAAWPRHLMIVQLAVCYGASGLQKVSGHWVPGGDFSAVYYILQEPLWQRFDMAWTAHWFWLTQLATAITWLWEVGAPLLLVAFWFRYTRGRGGRLRRWFNRLDVRTWYALVGLAMHLGIWVAMRVGPFGIITLAYYPCLWHPREWRAALDRLRQWRTGPRPPAARPHPPDQGRALRARRRNIRQGSGA